MDLSVLLAALQLLPILATAAAFSDAGGSYTAVSTPIPITRTYPVLSQSICPKGSRNASTGVCEQSCMRQYMTPHALPSFSWWNGMSWESETVLYTSPRWGDADGLHVPLTDQTSEYSRMEGARHLPTAPGFVVRGTGTGKAKSKAPWGSGKTRPPPTAATSPPTLSESLSCKPDQSLHRPVPLRDPAKGKVTGTLTPSNPDCDPDDPDGYDASEKLWLYQDQGKAECWDYESCYDHCLQLRHYYHLLWSIGSAIISVFCVLVAIAAVIKSLHKRNKLKRWTGKKMNESNKTVADREAGHDTATAAARAAYGPSNVDGAADDGAVGADEQSARRAAKLFKYTFKGRDVVASGSEMAPRPQEDNAVVKRG